MSILNFRLKSAWHLFIIKYSKKDILRKGINLNFILYKEWLISTYTRCHVPNSTRTSSRESQNVQNDMADILETPNYNLRMNVLKDSN